MIPSSIVTKLTWFVGALIVLNTALLIGAAYVTTSSILYDEVRDRLLAIASDRQEILLHELQERQDRTTSLAASPLSRRLFTDHASGSTPPERSVERWQAYLGNTRSHSAGQMALWVEDRRGKLVAGAGSQTLIDELWREDRIPVDQGTGAGLVVPPRLLDGTYVAVFAAEVRDDAGSALGTIFMAADVGSVLAFLGGTHGLGDHGEVLVGWKSGDRIQLPWPPRGNPHLTQASRDQFPSLDAAASGIFGFAPATDYRGQEVLVAYRPLGVGFPNWGLVAKLDIDEAYEPVARLRRLLLFLGAGVLALGLGASNAIARRFARPIKRLARTSAAVAAGDLTVRSEVTSSDELGALAVAFNQMTEELEHSYADLERRIAERTHDLEAVRDQLDAFFDIATSRLDPENIHKTFDTVLRSCSELGYDLAMISLIDRDAGVIRAERATRSMEGLVGLTVRPMDGGDVLAIAARDGRTIVVADAMSDPRCDAAAAAVADIHGLVVLPLVSDEVLGTLQVATRSPIDASTLDLRPLETLASHAARALAALRQVEEIRRLNQNLQEQAGELARSEQALREQTRILQSVLDCMGDGVVVADALGKFLVFNPAARRILGHDRSETPPSEWSRHYEVYLPDRLTLYPSMELPLSRAMRGESVDQVELYIAYPTREAGTWILVTGRPLSDDSGTIDGGVVVFHDITRRKNAERRLAAQYASTRVLAEADSLAQAGPRLLETIGTQLDWDLGVLWQVDPRLPALRCSTLWHRPEVALTAFAEASRTQVIERGVSLAGRVWSECAPEWTGDLAGDPRFNGKPPGAATPLKSAFGVPIVLQGTCLGVLEFASHEARPPDAATLDMMTSLGSQIGQFIERHQMQARVAQAERLASLGLLSAGVAHEINNPLAFIANNAAVLERDCRFLLDLIELYEQARADLQSTRPDLVRRIDALDADYDLGYVKDNLFRLLESTRTGIKRVADIVQNLRGFARVDRADETQADVHDAIRTALEMIRSRLTRHGIVVEERYSTVPRVAASPAQLNQVFLNLLVNAFQAIEETRRADGRIIVTTSATDGEVTVEVFDNGSGIPEGLLPHIFDPFFTTKPVGDGMGLGLSITHGMVSDHGGRLEVESTPGQGTRFRVILVAASD